MNAPVIFARWWQELDLLLHERGREGARYWAAKEAYRAGRSPRAAAAVLKTPALQGVK